MPGAIVVIPCYNEERRLDVPAFAAYLDAHSDTRLLFVDDGSTDGTWSLLQSLAGTFPENSAAMQLAVNSGKGEAVRQGILRALADAPRYVGFWDADLSTPLQAIDTLHTFADAHPQYEMVFGARVKLLGRTIERRGTRHYVGRVFATFASLVLQLSVYDTQCGAKLFRVGPEVAALFADPFVSRWLFDVELLARWIRASRRGAVRPAEDVVYEYPLVEWRHVRGSKLRATDYPRAALELLRIARTYCWSR